VIVVVVLLVTSGGGNGSGRFHVQGTKIVAPDGSRFVVRGVVIPYGTFAGGDPGGVGQRNATQFPADLRRLRGLGANTVRIFTTPSTGQPANWAKLQRLVAQARDDGFVVEISTTYATAQQSLPWVRRLATRYRDDPYVWLQPGNEPGCLYPPDQTAGRCKDWKAWQQGHRMLVHAIREAGDDAPIVINVPNYSTDLRPIDRYPLGDDDLIYGAHRYGNTNPTFSPRERQAVGEDIAGPARTHAVIVDEFGNYNGSQFPNSMLWTSGMTAWTSKWVASGQGQGAIGFTWRWTDGNTMVDSRNDLTPWGKLFADLILGPGKR
jgi:hypothetical protein